MPNAALMRSLVESFQFEGKLDFTLTISPDLWNRRAPQPRQPKVYYSSDAVMDFIKWPTNIRNVSVLLGVGAMTLKWYLPGKSWGRRDGAPTWHEKRA